jgi:hypothetical protein
MRKLVVIHLRYNFFLLGFNIEIDYNEYANKMSRIPSLLNSIKNYFLDITRISDFFFIIFISISNFHGNQEKNISDFQKGIKAIEGKLTWKS